MLTNINTFINNIFVHLISVVSIVAFFTPGLSQSVRAQTLFHGDLDASGVALFLMMLSAAIQCRLSALRAELQRPKPLLVCLAQYFLVLPVSCYLLGQLCVPLLGREVGEPIQIGLDLVILMPVAATATIWTRDTKGNIELLLSLIVLTMSIGTLTAPFYLHFMSGIGASSIAIPRALMLRHLAIGVLLPLATGVILDQLLRKNLARLQPFFKFGGNFGLFLAVFLNVGVAAPLLRQFSLSQVVYAVLLVLAVNVANFVIGAVVGRLAGLEQEHQVTIEFSSGMRSNGTALVVGLASFPMQPLVTIPAAIYIICQHLLAGIVRARLLAPKPVVLQAVVPQPILVEDETTIWDDVAEITTAA